MQAVALLRVVRRVPVIRAGQGHWHAFLTRGLSVVLRVSRLASDWIAERRPGHIGACRERQALLHKLCHPHLYDIAISYTVQARLLA